jgi:hypothetical protein
MADFIVETGAGLTGANTYVSVAEATDFLSKYGYDADASWVAADDATKEDALRLAVTTYIDGRFAHRYRGVVHRDEQAMAWPRVGSYDDSGRVIDTNEIPKQIKEAQALVALDIVKGNTILTDGADEGVMTRETKKSAGGFEITREYAHGTGGSKNVRRVRTADVLIFPLVRSRKGGVSL